MFFVKKETLSENYIVPQLVICEDLYDSVHVHVPDMYLDTSLYRGTLIRNVVYLIL